MVGCVSSGQLHLFEFSKCIVLITFLYFYFFKAGLLLEYLTGSEFLFHHCQFDPLCDEFTQVLFVFFKPTETTTSYVCILEKNKLEIVFYAFEGCKLGWFTTLQFSAGASCWILMVRLMSCTLCCVAARCGQKRWRNVASSVWAPVSPPRALEDSRSETGVWLEWGGHDCLRRRTSAALIAGAICISRPVKKSQGKEWSEQMIRWKWHLGDTTGTEREHCRCLSGTARRTWLVATRGLTRRRHTCCRALVPSDAGKTVTRHNRAGSIYPSQARKQKTS